MTKHNKKLAEILEEKGLGLNQNMAEAVILTKSLSVSSCRMSPQVVRRN